MVNTFPIKQRDWLLLLIIVFVAALMRFGQAGIVEFFHDDAMLSSLAQSMVAGEALHLTGINSSVGIPNPPQSVYVMLLPFAINSNPMTAIYIVMGLNVVGVALLWLFVHRYFGRTIALIAGLSYAISPWAVLYSRKIWAQDYHTPFVLLGILLAVYGFWEAQKQGEETKSYWRSSHFWAQVFALPVFLFAFQIHFAAWALMPIYLVILFVGRKQISWLALAVSAIVCVVVMLPYGIGLWQSLQANPERISESRLNENEEASGGFTIEPLQDMFYLATGFGMETWVAPEQQEEMNTVVPPISLWWLLGIGVIAGIGLLYRKSYRPFASLLLIWAFLPALSLIFGWTGVYPHYFIASIPPLMILLALAIATLTELVPLGAFGRMIILVAYGAILLTQATYFRGVLRYVNDTEIAYPGFTIPLHYLQDIEQNLVQFDDVVVLSNGMAWDLNHESVVWDVMLQDDTTCSRTLTGDGYAVIPNQPFVALQAPDMPSNGIGSFYQNDEATIFKTRSEAERYIVYEWQNPPSWQGAEITTIEPIIFDSGVQLTGYSIADGLLTLQWRLPAAIDGLDYQYSGQFFDVSGERLAQRDVRFWHGRHWCKDDILYTWASVDASDEATTLRVSLYQLGDATQPAFINANVLDEAGNPQGQYAEINLP